MKEVVAFVGAVLGLLILLSGAAWVVQGNSFFLAQYFMPRMEQVRRNTFEQSKAYNQGMVQELQNMQFQYEQADDAHKAALASIILHRSADYDQDRLPPDLYAFIQSLKRGS